LPKQSTFAGVALFLGLLWSATANAFAQATPGPIPTFRPSPSPAPTASPAPAPSPTPYKLITLQGSGDFGYSSVDLTKAARFVDGTPSRVFDTSTGPFFDENGGRQITGASDVNQIPDLQNINLSATFNGAVLSGKIEGSLGSDANVIASNGQSRSGTNLTQAYLQAATGPVTILLGKIETLAGAELIEAPLDTNYTRSYLFGYAIPFTHTGARLTYAVNPKVSVVAGANNGWDDWKFAGKKKTLEGALLLTPSPGVAWTIATYNGNDFAVNGNSAIAFAPVLTNRMLYDSVLTLKATSSLTLIANYDNGTQLPDSGAFFPMAAHWNGIAGYANYAFSSVCAVSIRKETFHDDQGFRTGLPGGVRVQSSTATFNYTPDSTYLFRLEYRLDGADKNAFTFRDAPAGIGRDHQSSVGVEAVVKLI
jgi:hypothetical protein